MRWLIAVAFAVLLFSPMAVAQSLAVRPLDDYVAHVSWYQWQEWDVSIPCADAEAEAWETRMQGLVGYPEGMEWTATSNLATGPYIAPTRRDMKYEEEIQCQSDSHLSATLTVQMVANAGVPPGTYDVPISVHLGSDTAPDIIPGEPGARTNASVVVPAWSDVYLAEVGGPFPGTEAPALRVAISSLANAPLATWVEIEHAGFPGCAHAGQVNGTAPVTSPTNWLKPGLERVELVVKLPGDQTQCPVESLLVTLFTDDGDGPVPRSHQVVLAEWFSTPIAGDALPLSDPPEKPSPAPVYVLLGALLGAARIIKR